MGVGFAAKWGEGKDKGAAVGEKERIDGLFEREAESLFESVREEAEADMSWEKEGEV